MKKALITGVTGMDGSHLADLLLDKGYEVHGLIRRHSTPSTSRIDHIFDRLNLHYGDLTDGSGLRNLIDAVKPDEVYGLGAQSHVRVSFDIPEYTADTDALGTLRLLEAIKGKGIKFYQASSSEMFGKVYETPQSETTPFYPRSPYGVAKVFAYWATVNYREMGEFAVNGILFNHEGERRGETFVSRKISKAAARIKLGVQDKLFLGNLKARRDWGYAKDYVEGMWRMMQHKTPDDYVLATGYTYSVLDFLDEAFSYLDIDWHKHVEIDPKYYRPTEVDILQGDASKAKRVLGWEATTQFQQLVRLMVAHDLEAERGFLGQ